MRMGKFSRCGVVGGGGSLGMGFEFSMSLTIPCSLSLCLLVVNEKESSQQLLGSSTVIGFHVTVLKDL